MAGQLGITVKSSSLMYKWYYPFKEFISYQAEYLSPTELVNLYDLYKVNFRKHKIQESVKANYKNVGYANLTYSLTMIKTNLNFLANNLNARRNEFLNDLNNSKYTDVNLSVNIDKLSNFENSFVLNEYPLGRVIGTAKLDNANICLAQAPIYGLEHDSIDCSVVYKHVSPYIQYNALKEALGHIEGIKEIVFLPSAMAYEYFDELKILLDKNLSDIPEDKRQKISKIVSECYIKHSDTNSSERPRTKEIKNFLPLQNIWLEFENIEQIDNAMAELSNITIDNISLPKPQITRENIAKKSRTHIVLDYENDEIIEADLEHAKKTIEFLDKFFDYATTSVNAHIDNSKMEDPDTTGHMLEDSYYTMTSKEDIQHIEKSVTADSKEKMSNKQNEFLLMLDQISATNIQLLDLCIVYLLRVHFFDFYLGRLNWNKRTLIEISGFATVRLNKTTSNILKNIETNYTLLHEHLSKLYNTDFEQYFKPLNENHPAIAPEWALVCKENIFPEELERYKCGLCGKVFKGPEYVCKHLLNKHDQLLNDIIDKYLKKFTRLIFQFDCLGTLAFLVECNDYINCNKNNREKDNYNSYYASIRRNKNTNNNRSAPFIRQDWDAPKNRLELKSKGSNFRTMMRYEDL